MLYHIALRTDWEQAATAGDYRTSTHGQTLEDVGFIHLSASPDQVRRVANGFYGNVEEPLLLLMIDPDLLASPVVLEAVDGGSERFPHLYGPLNLDAVAEVSEYQRADDGQFPAP